MHPKIAQQLARHSTITLTMDRYSHTVMGDLADGQAATLLLSWPFIRVRFPFDLASHVLVAQIGVPLDDRLERIVGILLHGFDVTSNPP